MKNTVQWEYLSIVVAGDAITDLSEYGLAGWEMVAAISPAPFRQMIHFKRLKLAASEEAAG